MDSQLLWPAEKRLPQMSYFHTYKLLYRQKVGHLNQKKKKKKLLYMAKRMLKIELKILTWVNCPGLFDWPKCNHKDPYKRKKGEDLEMLCFWL